MQWKGDVGPAFVVTLALAVLTAVGWFTDSKAALSERVAVVETQLKSIVNSVSRIETKIDNGR